jgi:2-polyprenyl-6-methoxyphenol hydroxylase-like FAD-dependent oxidoreductase
VNISPMPIDGTVLIAGAGIGGLALGCALQRAGIEFEIFERASTLSDSRAGMGILVQAGAMQALRHIGLDAQVANRGHDLQRGIGMNVAGTVLSTAQLDELPAPTVAVHRGALQSTFLQTLEERRIHTGKAIAGFEQDQTGVRLRFEDGTHSSAGALLIGADGLRSAVRRQLLADGAPRYAGYTSWRGIAPLAGLTPAREILEIWGRGLRFGIVPLGPDETYWFAVANAPAGEVDVDSRAVVLKRFAHFSDPVLALVRATPADRILRTDIQDRKPVRSWSTGRVALLGDAAHPTTPNLGQGGGMAIEDAVVLAHCLSSSGGLAAALLAYQAKRVKRTTAIVNASWQFGRLAQLEGGVSCWVRDLALRATPGSVIQRRLRENAHFSLE